MRKAIAHLRGCDPVLEAIIERVGHCRMTFSEPTFHSLARAIVYQQLQGRAAATIFARVTAAAGDPLIPEALVALTPPELRALGLSKQKAAYIQDLAAKVIAQEIVFEKLRRLPDAAVIKQLTRVKGIGVWTVHMFLMFAMRRPDVLPIGDLGIRNAIRAAYGFEQPPTIAEMQAIAELWRPHTSIACWYLWRSLDIKEPA